MLGGTVSAPPVGDGIKLVYFTLLVLLVGAALLTWVVGQVSFVSGAIRALQGKPAQAFWRKRHQEKGSAVQVALGFLIARLAANDLARMLYLSLLRGEQGRT